MRSVDTFLPQSRAKAELGLGGISDENPRLQTLVANREAAAAWVEQYGGIPVLDRGEVVAKEVPVEDDEVVIRRLFAHEVVEVLYWTPDADITADADGSLTGATLGRFSALPDGGGLRLFAPPDGWPRMNRKGGIYVRITSGISESHPSVPLIRQAGVLATRFFFNGAKLLEPNAGMLALLRPLRQLSGFDHDAPDASSWQGWDAAARDGEGVRLTFGGSGITFGGVRIGY